MPCQDEIRRAADSRRVKNGESQFKQSCSIGMWREELNYLPVIFHLYQIIFK